METTLRPIGTEFWHEFAVGNADTIGGQNRFLYRVVAHDNVLPSGRAERVDVVGHQRRLITGMHLVKLSDRAVLDYDFGEWQDV